MLRFSPTAWAKLLFFRDHGENEIGGFGITAPDDLLRIEEFVTVKQKVTVASVSFDDQAVADFFEAQVDAGRKPEQFARVWLHTHPGDSPQPSGLDEETFHGVFGRCQWAVLFILARSGNTYARLRFNVGPGGETLIPVEVDYGCPFGPSAFEAWEREYEANIEMEVGFLLQASYDAELPVTDAALNGCLMPDDWMEEFEAVDPAERQLALDELASRPDLWTEESEWSYDSAKTRESV